MGARGLHCKEGEIVPPSGVPPHRRKGTPVSDMLTDVDSFDFGQVGRQKINKQPNEVLLTLWRQLSLQHQLQKMPKGKDISV